MDYTDVTLSQAEPRQVSLADTLVEFELDVAIRALQLLDLDHTAMDDRQFSAVADQMRLPLALGGFGLVAYSKDRCSAAKLSASALADLTLHDGHDAFRSFAPESDATRRWNELRSADWATELQALPEGPAPTEALEHIATAQALVARRLDRDAQAALLSNYPTDTPEHRHARERIKSSACRSSSAYLDTLPTATTLVMGDDTFRSAGRLRLGLTSSFPGAPAVTCNCGELLDGGLRGDCEHALTCNRRSKQWILRHDLISNAVRRIASRATLASTVEPPMRRVGRGGDDASRGDVLVIAKVLTVLDISVIHPCAQTYIDQAYKKQADPGPGWAADMRDDEKCKSYKKGGYEGYAFIPFSVESYGRLGKPAMAFLNKLSRDSGLQGMSRHAFIASSLREISVALARGNTAIFRAGAKVYCRLAGKDRWQGMSEPMAEAVDFDEYDY